MEYSIPNMQNVYIKPRSNIGNGEIALITGVNSAAEPYIKNIHIEVVEVARKSFRISEPSPVQNTSMHQPINPKVINVVIIRSIIYNIFKNISIL